MSSPTRTLKHSTIRQPIVGFNSVSRSRRGSGPVRDPKSGELVTKKRKTTQTKTLGTATVNGGGATVTVKAKLVLSKTITVIYSGDRNFQASTVTVPKLPKNGL